METASNYKLPPIFQQNKLYSTLDIEVDFMMNSHGLQIRDIDEKFDGIRMNNFRKNFRQQIEIRDLKSQKKPSILDNYKKTKDNLRVRPCY